jgi:hypothetical protein
LTAIEFLPAAVGKRKQSALGFVSLLRTGNLFEHGTIGGVLLSSAAFPTSFGATRAAPKTALGKLEFTEPNLVHLPIVGDLEQKTAGSHLSQLSRSNSNPRIAPWPCQLLFAGGFALDVSVDNKDFIAHIHLIVGRENCTHLITQFQLFAVASGDGFLGNIKRC